MPSVSKKQQELMGAALARKRAGRPLPGDPQMTEQQLEDFARTPRKGLPQRVKPKKK